MTWPIPPPVPMRPMIASTMSFAVDPAGSSPSTLTLIHFGRAWGSVWVASTCSTSLVPMPKARAPNAPWVAVWLSPQTIVIPGSVRPCSGPITWTMPCNGSPIGNSVTPNSAALWRITSTEVAVERPELDLVGAVDPLAGELLDEARRILVRVDRDARRRLARLVQPRGVGRADVDPHLQRASEVADEHRGLVGLGDAAREGDPFGVLEAVREDARHRVLLGLRRLLRDLERQRSRTRRDRRRRAARRSCRSSPLGPSLLGCLVGEDLAGGVDRVGGARTRTPRAELPAKPGPKTPTMSLPRETARIPADSRRATARSASNEDGKSATGIH